MAYYSQPESFWCNDFWLEFELELPYHQTLSESFRCNDFGLESRTVGVVSVHRLSARSAGDLGDVESLDSTALSGVVAALVHLDLIGI